jgi:O-antigen ligase
MADATPLPAVPTAAVLWRRGNAVLWASLVLGLGAVLLVAVAAPSALPFAPLLLAGGTAVGYLLRHPLAHLCVVLAGFALVLDYEEGVQLIELIFGFYYGGYLAGWFAYHVFLRGGRLLHDSTDWAVVLFLGLSTVALLLGPFLGSDPFGAVSHWRAVLVLGFYFPIREACAREPRALSALLLVFLGLAVYVAVRNALRYQEALYLATNVYGVIGNRTRTNERLVMVALLAALAFLLSYAQTWRGRGLLLGLTTLLLPGVIMGQSRTIWLALGLAFGVMFLLLDRAERLRFVAAALVGGAALTAAAVLLLDDVLALILAGLSERFASIEGSTTQDLSLVNRFYEWGAALDALGWQFLFGRGLGVPYRFYSLIYKVTEVKYFSHSAYVGVLYRHGAVGLALFLYILAASFVRGVGLIRRRSSRLAHTLALACTVSIPAVAVAAATEDVMVPTDGVFVVMYPLALLAGLHRCAHLHPRHPLCAPTSPEPDHRC